MSNQNHQLPSRIYEMQEVLKMYPLLTTYSSLIEKKYDLAEKTANKMALLDESSEEHRICELELDMVLESLLDITAELKHEYGIGIFDPVTGAIKIPVYGFTTRSLVFLYFDTETIRDTDHMMVKKTEFGMPMAGLVPYNQS